MISSVELYDALDRETKKYYLWTTRYIANNQSLESPRDFFLHPQRRRHRKDFYLSIALAKSLLIREGTIISKQIRYYIEDNIERTARIS
jgi:phage anti-repressor protein